MIGGQADRSRHRMGANEIAPRTAVTAGGQAPKEQAFDATRTLEHGAILAADLTSSAQTERKPHMPAPLVKTRTPGVYKRGDRYCFVYRDADGRQHRESARTYEDARTLKRHREADVSRGEHHADSRLRFADYANEWIERYQGAGKGFREETRTTYRLLLRVYVLPYFGSKKLGAITPRDVANYIGWMCEQTTKGKKGKPGKPLSDGTIRKALTPLQSCLATAVREGLIRHNPARDVALPNRGTAEDCEDEEVRALTREQITVMLRTIDVRYRPMLRLIAATGLRISEAIGLQWRHVELNGDEGRVRVRRRIVDGSVGPPKSKRSRRDVPLPADVVRELRKVRMAAAQSADDDLVFQTRDGKPLNVRNLRRRHLHPAVKKAGAPWAGFHSLRHSCASMLFERGANVKQVSAWLGHADPAFTLRTYVHLLDDDMGSPLDLAVELAPTRHAADA